MGSMSGPSCRCCMFVVYILWQFSMLVDDTRGDHMEEAPNTPTQHGYKTQRSTVTALHTVPIKYFFLHS